MAKPKKNAETVTFASLSGMGEEKFLELLTKLIHDGRESLKEESES